MRSSIFFSYVIETNRKEFRVGKLTYRLAANSTFTNYLTD